MRFGRSEPDALLSVRLFQSPHVIGRERAVLLRERRLADVVAGEPFDALRGGERGERLAGVDLSGQGDGFETGVAADVCADGSEEMADEEGYLFLSEFAEVDHIGEKRRVP